MSTFEVHIGRADNGKWLAATAASPYLCFEADSAENALAVARRALFFYAAHRADISNAHAKREQEAISPRFREVHKELVCA